MRSTPCCLPPLPRLQRGQTDAAHALAAQVLQGALFVQPTAQFQPVDVFAGDAQHRAIRRRHPHPGRAHGKNLDAFLAGIERRAFVFAELQCGDPAVAEVGATSVKDMGRVMAVLTAKYTGSMDFGSVGALIKARLA